MKARLGQALAHTTAKRHQAFARFKAPWGFGYFISKVVCISKVAIVAKQAETEGRRSQGFPPARDSLPGSGSSPRYPPPLSSSLVPFPHGADQMRKLRLWLAGKSLLLQGSQLGAGLRDLNPPNSREGKVSLLGEGGRGAEQKAICSLAGATL